MHNRTLGDTDIFPIGLGCMPMSSHQALDHRQRRIETIHTALDAGVQLLDTANVYAPRAEEVGHNELLVAEALATYDGPKPLVATKGGITREPGEIWGRRGDPDYLLAAAEGSLQRLGTIDLYYLHRADPTIAFAEQIQGLQAVRDAGLARQIGVSNVNAAMLARALEVAGGPGEGGIVAVQNEYSPIYRADADVITMCTERGIAYLPWSPLQGADLFEVRAIIREVSPQQMALAWLLAQSPVVIPIPGSTRPQTILDSVKAARLSMSATEIEALNALPFQEQSLYPDHDPKPPL